VKELSDGYSALFHRALDYAWKNRQADRRDTVSAELFAEGGLMGEENDPVALLTWYFSSIESAGLATRGHLSTSASGVVRGEQLRQAMYLKKHPMQSDVEKEELAKQEAATRAARVARLTVSGCCVSLRIRHPSPRSSSRSS
jgi:hypothetical protein